MSRQEAGLHNQWIAPIVGLSLAALLIFSGLYFFDQFAGTGGASPHDAPEGAFARFLAFDPGTVSGSIGALGSMNTAVLGIVITVVSIIVQLSAGRYSGVASMFLRDRVNLGVMAYYVVASVCGLLAGVALRGDYVPRTTVVVMLMVTAFGMVLMAPYFGYVFRFVQPVHIIACIREAGRASADRGVHEQDAARSSTAQADTLSAMEELTDIASSSISGKDKILASAAVDALKDFTLSYLKTKPGAKAEWFSIGEELHTNPDFVAMDPESLGDLVLRKTWVEWKVLRQYFGIYTEALAQMRDITYLIAIDTRYIGEAAVEAGDDELIELVFRYLNSYLRATINGKDVRTAYNVLNQYRLLLEALVRKNRGALVLEGVRYMIYYGHVSYELKIGFVTETIAYDVSTLCQVAFEGGFAEADAMLTRFLDLDRPLRVRSQESALLGVRKAQVKLAAYFLAKGETARARQIADDMAGEPSERLGKVRDELVRVKTKDFWEITDRGRNFEYMPETIRGTLPAFFEWLPMPQAPAPAPFVTPPDAPVPPPGTPIA